MALLEVQDTIKDLCVVNVSFFCSVFPLRYLHSIDFKKDVPFCFKTFPSPMDFQYYQLNLCTVSTLAYTVKLEYLTGGL